MGSVIFFSLKLSCKHVYIYLLLMNRIQSNIHNNHLIFDSLFPLDPLIFQIFQNVAIRIIDLSIIGYALHPPYIFSNFIIME